mgnify:CR=1 FL=1
MLFFDRTLSLIGAGSIKVCRSCILSKHVGSSNLVSIQTNYIVQPVNRITSSRLQHVPAFALELELE